MTMTRPFRHARMWSRMKAARRRSSSGAAIRASCCRFPSRRRSRGCAWSGRARRSSTRPSPIAPLAADRSAGERARDQLPRAWLEYVLLFEVHALAPTEFQAWYDQQVAAASATPPPAPSGGTGGGPAVNVTAEGVKHGSVGSPARRPGSRSISRTRTTGCHTTSRSSTRAARRRRQQGLPGSGRPRLPIQPLPAGTYKFQCSIHPTRPARSRSIRELRWRPRR